MAPPRVLLVGYNGANNTGADALLLSDIRDLRAVLGTDVRLTVPTLNAANLRRCLSESPTLRIVTVPPVFPFAVRRLVKEHDLVMLVEGSTYMDSWTSALLWLFLWATHCAHGMGKPCLAYAVDAGRLSPANQRRVRREASRTDLIIVRSQAAAERLHACGVTAPIEATADNAFTFSPAAEDEGWVLHEWPEAGSGLAGLAVVDFYLWPVVIRPWGPRARCYRWPYYYSHSAERTRAAAALAADYAALADHLVQRHGKAIALICMEQLDEPLAEEVNRRMAQPGRARVFSSRQHNASQMTVLLRNLDVLVTSRYHACVLSLAAQVPQLAVGHDLRLKTIYGEMGLLNTLFLDHQGPSLRQALVERADRLLADPAAYRRILRRGYEERLAQARRNRELLRGFVRDRGWLGMPTADPAWQGTACSRTSF